MHERVKQRLEDFLSDSKDYMEIKTAIMEGSYPWSGLKYYKAKETLICCKSVAEFHSLISVNKEHVNCKGGCAYLAQAIFRGYVVDEAVYCPQKDCWNSNESCSVYEKTKIDFDDCTITELLNVKEYRDAKQAQTKLHAQDQIFFEQFTLKDKKEIKRIQTYEFRYVEHAWTLLKALYPKSYLLLKELKCRDGESNKTLRKSKKADIDKWAEIIEYTGSYPHDNIDGLQGEHTCFNVYFGGALVGIYIVGQEA